jgi:hypothetical protein
MFPGDVIDVLVIDTIISACPKDVHIFTFIHYYRIIMIKLLTVYIAKYFPQM